MGRVVRESNFFVYSWSVHKDARGRGLGYKIVEFLKERYTPAQAVVHKDNVASIKIAEKCSFRLKKADGNWLIYELT